MLKDFAVVDIDNMHLCALDDIIRVAVLGRFHLLPILVERADLHNGANGETVESLW